MARGCSTYSKRQDFPPAQQPFGLERLPTLTSKSPVTSVSASSILSVSWPFVYSRYSIAPSRSFSNDGVPSTRKYRVEELAVPEPLFPVVIAGCVIWSEASQSFVVPSQVSECVSL